MTLTSLLIIASVALLLIMFFAGIETAFINANRLSIELKKKQGRRSGIILSNFIEEPGKFISAMRSGYCYFAHGLYVAGGVDTANKLVDSAFFCQYTE